MDSSTWVARIKWRKVADPVTVSVSKIRDFNPTGLNDFDRNKWYRVKSDPKYWNDGKEHSDFALIGAIAETEHDLDQAQGRIKFSSVDPPADDPASTASEAEHDDINMLSTNKRVASQLASVESVKKCKDIKRRDRFRKFGQKQIALDGPSTSINIDDTPKRKRTCEDEDHQLESPTDSSQTELDTLRKQIKLLEEQKKILEEEKANENEKILERQMKRVHDFLMNNLKTELDNFKTNLTANIETKLSEGFNLFEKKSIAIEDILKKQDWLNPRGNRSGAENNSSATSLGEDSVRLSDRWDYSCSKYSMTQMEEALKDSDWAGALLRGVFGKDAHLYRVYPRTPGLLKFPSCFFDMAREIFRKWLESREVDPDEVDESVSGLPSYLADIAGNMKGHRGGSRRGTPKSKKNVVQKNTTAPQTPGTPVTPVPSGQPATGVVPTLVPVPHLPDLPGPMGPQATPLVTSGTNHTSTESVPAASSAVSSLITESSDILNIS